MRVFSIASGSSGNCIFVEGGGARILVDAGISAKRIVEGLTSRDIDPDTIDAIFVTHEHTDHTAGLPVLLKKFRVPVYGTYETLHAVIASDHSGKLAPELFHSIQPGRVIGIRDAVVSACYVSHDAAKPVAYAIEADGRKFAMATDLGCYDNTVIEHLSGADAVYIESNYDRDMLLVGPYPFSLKRRIMGTYGHLSNEDCGSLIVTVLHRKLRYVILAHLSKENNMPDIAYANMRYTLDHNWHYTEPCPELIVAPRDMPTDIFTL